MDAASRLSVRRALLSLPILRRVRDRRHYAHFLSERGFASFYGVFPSFEEARRRLPKSEEFNERDLAAEYVDVRTHRIFAYDYPVMYWLREAFGSGSASIFDLGGSVGVHFHAYRPYLPYPTNLRWEVCETPEIAKVGRELAERFGASNLTFVDSLNPHELNADIWLSAGALQYVEGCHLGSLIQTCQRRPAHIILNKVPLYDGEDFVTVQNVGGGCYAPSYVYNKPKLIQDVRSCGYDLVSSWSTPERAFYLPGHPERSFESFSGLYFKDKDLAHAP